MKRQSRAETDLASLTGGVGFAIPRITLLLGEKEWEDSLYRKNERPRIEDLFDESDGNAAGERINATELGTYITEQLRSIFAYAPNPVELTQKNRPLLLFYFAVSNGDAKAASLADRIVKPVMRKYGGPQ